MCPASRMATESRTKLRPTPDRTRSSIDASWSTSATRRGSRPVSEPGPKTRRCSRWCALAGGVASQGRAAPKGWAGSVAASFCCTSGRI